MLLSPECRISGMKKFILIMLYVLLLFSCTTARSGNSYTADEKRAAISLLASDVLELVRNDGNIDSSLFVQSLSETYRAYYGYCPIYESLSAEYAASLSEIISPLLDAAYPILIDAFSQILESDGMDTIIASPEGLTDALQSIAARDIYSVLIEDIASVSSDLDQAFSESYGIFMSLRDAYLNLSIVGEQVSLPVPQAISTDLAAFIAEDALFTRIAEHEVALKSRIPDSPDSLYSVFWEESI